MGILNRIRLKAFRGEGEKSHGPHVGRSLLEQPARKRKHLRVDLEEPEVFPGLLGDELSRAAVNRLVAKSVTERADQIIAGAADAWNPELRLLCRRIAAPLRSNFLRELTGCAGVPER